MSSLSVCVVTKNEAKNIGKCLSAVSWADEIIVIDSKSTDNTVKIASKYTDKITIAPWKGCGPQKKQAYELATKEWVLILDADEFVSSDLQEEIKEAIKKDEFAGYELPFQTYYCGKAIRFGDWVNEKHLRLVKRNKASIVPRLVHFRVELQGKIGKLKAKVEHHSFKDLSVVIDKMNRYSTDGAIHKNSQGKKSNIWQAIGHGLFAFIRGYILKLGFLDGKEGFMLAVSNAEGSYYRYIKMLYLK